LGGALVREQRKRMDYRCSLRAAPRERLACRLASVRLADRYYGYSDPFRGYYDYHALPPLNPGYGYVRPLGLGWR